MPPAGGSIPTSGSSILKVISEGMSQVPEGVYKTESGMVFRVGVTAERGLKVEVLRDGVWEAGRIGMVGLRLSPTTKMLTEKAIRSLPA